MAVENPKKYPIADSNVDDEGYAHPDLEGHAITQWPSPLPERTWEGGDDNEAPCGIPEWGMQTFLPFQYTPLAFEVFQDPETLTRWKEEILHQITHKFP